MSSYSIFLLITCVYSLFFSRTKFGPSMALINYVFITVAFIAFEVYRNPMSAPDMYNYQAMYYSLNDFSNVFDVYHNNYLFSFVQYLGRYFGISFETWLVYFSLFLYFTFSLAIYNLTKKLEVVVYSMAILLCTSSFLFMFHNTIRQGLAIALFIYGYSFFLKKKLIFSYSIFILSFFSHFSVFVIIFIAYFSSKKVFNKFIFGKLKFVIPFFCVAISPLFVQIFVGFFDKLSSLDRAGEPFLLFFLKFVTLYIFVMFYGEVVQRFNFRGDLPLHFYRLCYYILVFVALTSSVTLFSSRYLYYLAIFTPIAISIVVYNFDFKNFTNFSYFLSLILLVIYFVFVYTFPSTSYLTF